MGDLIQVDFRRNAEAPVPKKQMAAMLGRSTRWLELRVREGMPSQTNGNRRTFRLTEVRDWLASQGGRTADG
jgi:phage terminase Nu1 subunit (DNA packaging protein)